VQITPDIYVRPEFFSSIVPFVIRISHFWNSKRQRVLHHQLEMEEVPCSDVLHFKWIRTGIRVQLSDNL